MTYRRSCASCDQKNTQKSKVFRGMKSKNVLDIRMVPGDPQGAWVECYNNSFEEEAQEGIAEIRAYDLHTKYEMTRIKRDEKLKQFRSEVSQRVRYLEQLKREQLRIQSLKKDEDEQNVILQRTLGLKIPYRGTVEDLQALNKQLLKSCIIPCDTNKLLFRKEVDKSNLLLSKMCSEVSTESSNAKKSLLRKSINTNRTKTNGTPIQVHPPKTPPSFDKSLERDTWTGNFEIKTHQLGDNSCVEEDQHKQETEVTENQRQHQLCPVNYDTHTGQTHDPEEQSVEEVRHDVLSNRIDNPFSTLHAAEELGISSLHKNLILDWCKKRKKETIDGKKQTKHQYWNYRKIFMEIEREQVQEARRKQEHRQRILKLKIEKEKEREYVQDRLSQFPETTLISVDHNRRSSPTPTKHAEEDGFKLEDKENEKELYRYIEALQDLARERLRVSNVSLPSLCPCGPSLWDSHPETCANNCVFYKNPKGYVRALATILANNR